MKTTFLVPLIAAVFVAFTPSLQADSLPALVRKSTRIVETKQGSAYPIPASALKAALGVAVLDVTKGGFIIGGMDGQGVLVIKAKHGIKGMFGISSWCAPIPLEISGGSFGAQIGGSRTKTIILLNTEQAIRVFSHPGRLIWGGSATGTAGSDTRSEEVNDRLSEGDITVYSQTEGLFGGATLGGSGLDIDNDTIQEAYGNGIFVRDILEGKVKTPDYASSLTNLLNGKR
jgi:lipid-binding SYLF domain-containing protein